MNGEPTTDPDAYYAVRNRGWFLAVKLLYNTGAAVGGGYLAALIAGVAEVRHGIALAAVQTIAFAWALTQPDVSRWTPGWMWVTLIAMTIAGILVGARLGARRNDARMLTES